MKNKKMTYDDLALRKEKLHLKVAEQELKVRDGFRQFGHAFTPAGIGNRMLSWFLNNPELTARIGLLVLSFFKTGKSRRKKSRGS